MHGQNREVDVFDVKCHIENILSLIGAPSKFQILRGAESHWHPGRHGRICLGPKKTIGIFGELHPKILSSFDIKAQQLALPFCLIIFLHLEIQTLLGHRLEPDPCRQLSEILLLLSVQR